MHSEHTTSVVKLNQLNHRISRGKICIWKKFTNAEVYIQFADFVRTCANIIDEAFFSGCGGIDHALHQSPHSL